MNKAIEYVEEEAKRAYAPEPGFEWWVTMAEIIEGKLCLPALPERIELDL